MLKRKYQLLGMMALSSTFAFTTCSTNIRDALIGGALDWVSGSATDILSSVFPTTTLFDLPGTTDNTSNSDAR